MDHQNLVLLHTTLKRTYCAYKAKAFNSVLEDFCILIIFLADFRKVWANFQSGRALSVGGCKRRLIYWHQIAENSHTDQEATYYRGNFFIGLLTIELQNLLGPVMAKYNY
jgi:hypothetical protein